MREYQRNPCYQHALIIYIYIYIYMREGGNINKGYNNKNISLELFILFSSCSQLHRSSFEEESCEKFLQ